MVVDDHPAFRMGLIALIESQSDMAVVAECGNGCEAVEMFRQVRPDVTLMDLRLPGQSGVEAILTIRKEFPQGCIIVITTFDCDEDIYRACESGAKAYLFKDASKDEIINAIRTVHAGQRWLPTKVASRLDECLKRPNSASGRWMCFRAWRKAEATRKSPPAFFCRKTRSRPI